MTNEEKEEKITSLIFLIIFGTIFVCCLCIFVHDQISQRKNFLKTWNNGHHATDNGKWVMSQAVGHRRGTTYIYKCDKCGAWIELGNAELYWSKQNN